MSWKNELPTRIYIIYKTYSQVQHNGYFSECITLERGVRQRCPLSFPLFCTQNDVFTSSVNQDKTIKGFKLPGRKENLKLSLYADNTSFISTNFSAILFIFEQFLKCKKAPGCTLNIDKTDAWFLIQTNRVLYDNNKFPIKWNITEFIKNPWHPF